MRGKGKEHRGWVCGGCRGGREKGIGGKEGYGGGGEGRDDEGRGSEWIRGRGGGRWQEV